MIQTLQPAYHQCDTPTFGLHTSRIAKHLVALRHYLIIRAITPSSAPRTSCRLSPKPAPSQFQSLATHHTHPPLTPPLWPARLLRANLPRDHPTTPAPTCLNSSGVSTTHTPVLNEIKAAPSSEPEGLSCIQGFVALHQITSFAMIHTTLTLTAKTKSTCQHHRWPLGNYTPRDRHPDGAGLARSPVFSRRRTPPKPAGRRNSFPSDNNRNGPTVGSSSPSIFFPVSTTNTCSSRVRNKDEGWREMRKTRNETMTFGQIR